jgi:acetyl esterase/lipase
VRYGTHPSQYGVLHLPDTPGPWPVAVVVHGGFWRGRYGAELGTPLAEDLAAAGVAAWNLEYRRLGSDRRTGGGGWPNSCLDVAAGVDLLGADVQLAAAGQLDLTRVVAVGHSAGGQLAAWLASRTALPDGTPGAEPALTLTGFVSQAGVLDLDLAEAENLGDGAVSAFLAASRRATGRPVADSRLASPMTHLPTGARSVCVHGTADGTVPISQSERYVAAAQRAGDDSRLISIEGADHFALIDGSAEGWAICRQALLELVSSVTPDREL